MKAPVVLFPLVFGFWSSAVAGRFVAVAGPFVAVAGPFVAVATAVSAVAGRACFSPGPGIVSVTRFLEGNGA